MKILYAAILICSVIFSGSTFYGKQLEQENFEIIGNLRGFKDSTKFYLFNLDSVQNIDSTYLIHQKIFLKGHVNEPAIYRLYPEDSNSYFNLWIENKHITLTGDREHFSELIVQGSPLNDIFRLAENQHSDLDKLRDSLAMIALNEPNKDKVEEIWKNIFVIDTKIKDIRIKTIETFQPSLVTIKELYFLRNDLTINRLTTLFNQFPSILKNTKYGDVIKQYILVNDLKIGSQAPDIWGRDLYNKEIKLSHYLDRVILLDFWAPWCKPCRDNNKDLAKLYKKYSNKHFEIISFSVDNDPDSWKLISDKDSIVWTNISDLKGFYSEQVASYKIRAIPKSFLIDKNGIIVYIFNGYDENLKMQIDNKIQEYLER